MKCRKCGSGNMGVMPNKKNPSATDLYCLDCGAWQKFATKDEIRLYQCKKGPITNALEQLQAELERVKQLYESEKEDFIDYACSGVPNLSPYCTNRHPDCVDERGWCRTEKCHGFSRNRDQKEDI